MFFSDALDLSSPYGESQTLYNLSWGASWNYLIGRVGPALMHEASEEQIHDLLGKFVFEIAYEENYYSIPPDAAEFSEARITPESADEVIVQLFALGIITRGTKRRSISDDRKYWALSQLGEDTLLKLRARRKPEHAH